MSLGKKMIFMQEKEKSRIRCGIYCYSLKKRCKVSNQVKEIDWVKFYLKSSLSIERGSKQNNRKKKMWIRSTPSSKMTFKRLYYGLRKILQSVKTKVKAMRRRKKTPSLKSNSFLMIILSLKINNYKTRLRYKRS